MRTSGYSPQELLGRDPKVLAPAVHRARASLRCGTRCATAGPGAANFSIDAKTAPSTSISRHHADSPGRRSISHYLSFQEDITERKRLGAELDRHRHHLQELVRERTEQLSEALLQAQAGSRPRARSWPT